MDDKSYAVAQQKSYAGQRTTFTFPKRRGIVEVPLGFQPLGISTLGSTVGSTVAIADYFGPSVMLAELSFQQGAMQFSNIRWIRGTVSYGKGVRMFPNVYEPGGANRMQAVLIYAPTRLGLVRNGNRQIFPIVLRADGKWVHDLVSPFPAGGLDMVHSATFTYRGLVTIESDEKAGRWAVCDYRDKEVKVRETVPYRYGIDIRSDGAVVTVSDYRAKEHGLYIGDKLQIPGLVGNGVALLAGGKSGALITRYGHGHPGPFNGVPGNLIYIPPRFLE